MAQPAQPRTQVPVLIREDVIATAPGNLAPLNIGQITSARDVLNTLGAQIGAAAGRVRQGLPRELLQDARTTQDRLNALKQHDQYAKLDELITLGNRARALKASVDGYQHAMENHGKSSVWKKTKSFAGGVCSYGFSTIKFTWNIISVPVKIVKNGVQASCNTRSDYIHLAFAVAALSLGNYFYWKN